MPTISEIVPQVSWPLPQMTLPGRPAAVPVAWPPPLPCRSQAATETQEPSTLSTPLLFDEGEVARLAASAAFAAERRARKAAAEELADRQAAAFAQLAASLCETMQRQSEETEAVREQLLRLVRTIAGAITAEAGSSGSLAAVDRLLRALPKVPMARLLVDQASVEAVRVRLADLVAGAGFAGSLEVEGDVHLEPGAVRLVWAEGWSEHAPARLGRLIDAALAGQGAASISKGGSAATRTNGTQEGATS